MRKSILLLILFSVLSLPVYGREYVISMLPRYYPDKLTSMMNPLAEYLSDQLGEKVRFELTKNFTDYENKVNNGTIDIGYENPLIFSKITSAHEAVAMAVDAHDGEKFRGIVITRPDSDVKKLEDLSGKTVMIVSDTSAGGYLSQLLSLNKAHMEVKGITFLTAAENRQENVIIPVSTGDVDAGFIRESAFGIADKYIMPKSIHTVAETAWLPNWSISVKRDLPPEVRQKLVQAILSLKADDPILKAIGIAGFAKASDDDYAIMKGLVK